MTDLVSSQAPQALVADIRQLIEASREGTKGECAISVRIIVDELLGDKGLQAEDVVAVTRR